jgi:hypothetical protein
MVDAKKPWNKKGKERKKTYREKKIHMSVFTKSEQENIASDIMPHVLPITDEDRASNNRIEKERYDWIYEKFCVLWERQVKSASVLQKTLWVCRATVYKFIADYEKDLRIVYNSRVKEIEKESEYRILSRIIRDCFGELKTLTGKDKIDWSRGVVSIMRNRWDLLWLYDWEMLLQQSKNIKNVPQDEISQLTRAVSTFKQILQWVAGTGTDVTDQQEWVDWGAGWDWMDNKWKGKRKVSKGKA